MINSCAVLSTHSIRFKLLYMTVKQVSKFLVQVVYVDQTKISKFLQNYLLSILMGHKYIFAFDSRDIVITLLLNGFICMKDKYTFNFTYFICENRYYSTHIKYNSEIVLKLF